jgi:putative intracellular protease/amidase
VAPDRFGQPDEKKRIEMTNRHSMKTKTLHLILAISAAGHVLNASAADTRLRLTSRPPVLMIIADQQDFYYQEYADTRASLEGSGLAVKVAATTTARSIPSPNTGQPPGTDGGVVPDLPLSDVNADDYSAIVFVGGWGSSMYQYAYNDPNLDGVPDSFYVNGPYNGDDDLNDGKMGEAKVIVNNLIKQFTANSRPVAAICHGVSVLAWARVDGVSPLRGKKVASSSLGSPAAYYLGQYYPDYEFSLHEHVVVNGGFTNPYSGQFGDPNTAADDVVVDGRIITAESHESAPLFGRTIAAEIAGRKN